MKFRFMLLWLFVALSAAANESSKAVLQAEYFWDTDPGPGLGIPFPAADGVLDEAVESLFKSGVTPPSGAGPHAFRARVRDSNGNWGDVFTTIIHAAGGENNPPRTTQVVMAEYFWDTDPGLGAATPLAALDGGLDESIESLIAGGISVPVATGGHTFNVRIKDADGQWSPLFTTVVEVRADSTLPPRESHVAQAEYFWDTDPGLGSGTPFPATDGTLDEVIEQLAAGTIPAPTGVGPHKFHARLKDADGQWSPAFATVVEVFTPAVPRSANLVQAEYFWDTDPGPGNGTPMFAADGTLNETLEALMRDPVATPGTFGPHRFHARVKDAAGVWGPVFRTVVNSHIGNGSIYVYDEDDDGDTLPNLVEYFLGTNPKQRDNPADYHSWGMEPVPGGNGESRLFVEIQRNHVAPDATLDVQVSTNLTDWHGTGDGWVVLQTETPSSLRFHTADSLEGEPKFFHRLMVTMNAP